MHGDFSRGHRPDAKRGQSYLRGFAQQRRLLLDSDLNAMTDALHERLRALSRHTACPGGSPDLGCLVTPGALLAVFREIEGVVVASSNVTYYRDYQQKYLDRYPSLRAAADQGVAGTITIHLRYPANGQTVFWCRAEALTNVTASGVGLAVPAGALQPVTVNYLAAQSDLVVSLDPGEEIWIGLIESRQNATLVPYFNFAAGNYYLNGLPLRNPQDVSWVTNLLSGGNFQVDNPARSLQNGDRLLAYLEAWERHKTFVEDPGVMERALGGDTDTTTRGEAVGQVKLAWVPVGFDLDAFARSLKSPQLADRLLNVTTPAAVPDPDPCALPVQGGYTGRDNRLYRFEVHTGGALGVATLKWSRDNGSELFPAVTATNTALTFPANTLLRPGDLVEVLAEVVETGDVSAATLAVAGTFTPAVRAVGRLVQLQAGVGGGAGVTFTMVEPDGTPTPPLGAHFGPFPSASLKVRRWHGIIQTTVVPVPNVVDVENGIKVELSGSFSPGDYWQYEARAGGDNANGPFQQTPHGPERNFGPLALLQFNQQNQPLLLERWLDDRFPPLCELSADDIAFDGDRIGTDSNTVQEVIEELWERNHGGCCEFTITAQPGDSAAVIRQILLDTQGEVAICLEPGIYTFTTTLDIAGRKVGIKGCPRAVIVAAGAAPLFHVQNGGRLELEELTLFGRGANGSRLLIDMDDNSESLEANGVGFFLTSGAASPPVAVRVSGQEPGAVNLSAPVTLLKAGFSISGPAIHMQACVAAAAWIVSANTLALLDIRRSSLMGSTGCIWVEELGNGVLVDSDLTAGMGLTALLGWTNPQLLNGADGLVDGLAVAIAAAPIADSLCVRARSMARTTLLRCRFKASMSLATSEPIGVTLTGNLHTASRSAIYVGSAIRMQLEGERINASGQSATMGVQLVLAGGLSMNDCIVSGFRVGVALGAEAAGANQRTLEDIQVQACQIQASSVGVQVGPADANTYAGLLRQTSISENNIVAGAVGVLVNAKAVIGTSGTFVRVADNLILSRLGVGLAGTRAVVSGNRLHLVNASTPCFGVVGLDTIDLVCEENDIERRPASTGDGQFLQALSAANLTAAGVFGPYVSGAGPQSAAILLTNGASARVAANTTDTDGLANFTGLSVTNLGGMQVKQNEFLSGSCLCTTTNSIVLLGNTVVGPVQILRSQNGIVCDNRVFRGPSLNYPGDISITSASGKWKVCDNRADGTIQILPTTRFSFGSSWYDILNYRASPLGSRFGVLSEMAAMSGNKRLGDIIFMRSGGGGGGAREAVDSGSFNMASGSSMYALRSESWMEEYTNGIRDLVFDPLSDLPILYDPGIIIYVPYSQENAYQVLCTDNWSGGLSVGFSNLTASPNSQTAVQVISNRVDGALSVQLYTRRIVAMNAADSFTQGATSSPAMITSPNLVI